MKDEGGEIGFSPADVPLARSVGATRRFYDPKALVGLAHRNGIYMIGRVVCFQDPKLAQARPGPGGATPRRKRVDDERGSWLGQPVRPPRLGLLRLGGRGGGPGGLRPDHVRLRAVPVRRGYRECGVPGQDERRARSRDRGLRRLCEEASRAAWDACLGSGLRVVRHARSRDRPGAALDLEGRRQPLAHVLPGALRRRRARARRARARSRERPCSGRSRTSAAR